jgi:hypothetical protein
MSKFETNIFTIKVVALEDDKISVLFTYFAKMAFFQTTNKTNHRLSVLFVVYIFGKKTPLQEV